MGESSERLFDEVPGACYARAKQPGYDFEVHVLDVWQWALALLGAFLVGLSKTGIAGLGVLTVAIFASILPARESIGIVLVVLLAGDLVAVTVYRRQASWRHLVRLFPWAALGIVLGALMLGRINEPVLRGLIGGILVLLVIVHAVRQRRSHVPENAHLSPIVATVTGLLAGFTTMVANAAGPIMILYLLAMRLPKMQFIGTAAWFFLAVNMFKVPFSYGLGLISLGSLSLSLQLMPITVVGALTGRWVITYINQQFFETLALVLTLLAGIRLLLM